VQAAMPSTSCWLTSFYYLYHWYSYKISTVLQGQPREQLHEEH